MSDTPRTDAATGIYALNHGAGVVAYAVLSARFERELAAMTRERDDALTRLRIEKECRAANKYAVVDTVGGWVEGQPTTEFNYLQRLRELVVAELELERIRTENEKLRKLLREIEIEDTMTNIGLGGLSLVLRQRILAALGEEK